MLLPILSAIGLLIAAAGFGVALLFVVLTLCERDEEVKAEMNGEPCSAPVSAVMGGGL